MRVASGAPKRMLHADELKLTLDALVGVFACSIAKSISCMVSGRGKEPKWWHQYGGVPIRS